MFHSEEEGSGGAYLPCHHCLYMYVFLFGEVGGGVVLGIYQV